MWKLKFPRKIQILSALVVHWWPSSKAPDLPWHPQWLPWVPPIVGGLLTIRLGAQILLTGDELAKTFLEKSSFLPHVLDLTSKVEKILKGGLDSTPSPSPSLKIQIMGGKVCSRCKGKHCWALTINFLFSKFVYNTQQCFAFTPKENFSAHNLNF